ncbi:MAG: hypothetical protein R2712_30590 [Vicinamibacterales bacterium]
MFNPTNVALVLMLLVTDAAWVSPGQWGTHAIFAFGMACAGLAVVHRATRSDVTVAFLAAYAGLVARSVGSANLRPSRSIAWRAGRSCCSPS